MVTSHISQSANMINPLLTLKLPNKISFELIKYSYHMQYARDELKSGVPTNFRSIINHSAHYAFSDWPKAYSAIPQPRPTLLWISQKSDPITVYNLMLSVPLRSYSISPSKVTLETSYFYCNGFRFVDRKYGRPIVKYGRPITIEQSTNRGLLSIDCHISRLSVDIAT